VTIEDNGQGFDVQKVMGNQPAGGRGLQNQRRRAQAIKGVVQWESKPTGTRFVLWLPLQREKQAA
jgi:signal transduction histidine kinase